MRLSLLFVFILFGPVLAQAEMYRWVDDEGKVHFSDKKPGDREAEDISERVKRQNTDYGGRSAKQQLEQYDRNRAARSTEREQKQQLTSKGEEQRKQACNKARRELRIIKGRVIFLDKNNKEIKVTEKERAQKALVLEQQIKKYCG